jgi:hypothetical protein
MSFERNSNTANSLRDSMYYLSSGEFQDYEKELNNIIKHINWGASYELF